MGKVASYAALVMAFSFGSFASANEAPKADNTAQNRGAMQKDAVTAEKEGNGKNQVAILAEVRKSIMAEKDLSMDAKNVKILYSKGLVTLRGPVDSVDEKAKVEEIAKGCGGVSAVKNMLTVAVKAH